MWPYTRSGGIWKYEKLRNALNVSRPLIISTVIHVTDIDICVTKYSISHPCFSGDNPALDITRWSRVISYILALKKNKGKISLPGNNYWLYKTIWEQGCHEKIFYYNIDRTDLDFIRNFLVCFITETICNFKVICKRLNV